MRKRLLLLVILAAAAGAGVYAYTRMGPNALVLTGIVTTNDVIVSPQISGQIAQLLVKEGDTLARDQVGPAFRRADLNAGPACFARNVAGRSPEAVEEEAPLRFQHRRRAAQITKAEPPLAPTERQVAGAAAD